MQTVLATFDDMQEAQSAVDQLIAEGFTRANVHLQQGLPGATAGVTPGVGADEGRGLMSGVGHFFSHLFGSDGQTHAGNYSEAVRRGSSVVAVDASSDSEVDRITALMNKMGSVDVEQRAAQWKRKGWTGFDADAGLMSRDDDAFAAESVPVVQEELHVGKREINVGGLRVVKRFTETPVSQIVTLRQEHATIERHPVDRVATEADFANFKEGTVEVREMAEEAVVGKSARVVEEVRVGKDVTEKSQTINDTVRRTDVDTERLAGASAARDASGTAKKV